MKILTFPLVIMCCALVLTACDDGIDKQAPRAAIASPVSNASLTGQGTAQITAADDIGVTAVRLYAQGKDNSTNRVSLGSAVVEPFVIGFDTRRLPNGSEVQLVAVAEDGSGKLGESDPVNVQIANTDVPSLIGLYAFTLPTRNTAPSAIGNCTAATKLSSSSHLSSPARLQPPAGITAQSIQQDRQRLEHLSQQQAANPYEVVLEWEWNSFGGLAGATNGYGVYCAKNQVGPYSVAIKQGASTGTTQKFSKTMNAQIGDTLYGLVTPVTQNATVEGGYSNADTAIVLPVQEVSSPNDAASVPDGRPFFTFLNTAGTSGYFLEIWNKDPLMDNSGSRLMRLPTGDATTDQLNLSYPSSSNALVSGTYYWWVAGVSFNTAGKADSLTYSKPRTIVVP
jgi:Bacterial Ig domain